MQKINKNDESYGTPDIFYFHHAINNINAAYNMMLPTTTLLICMILLQNTVAWSPGLHIITPRKSISSSSTTRLMMVADDQNDDDIKSNAKHSGYNVLGTELSCCCSNVGGSGIGTGFYRNGYCGRYI